MATHSSVLAWRIPAHPSLVGCCLWGRIVGDNGNNSAAAVARDDKQKVPDILELAI